MTLGGANIIQMGLVCLLAVLIVVKFIFEYVKFLTKFLVEKFTKCEPALQIKTIAYLKKMHISILIIKSQLDLAIGILSSRVHTTKCFQSALDVQRGTYYVLR